jgi:hypothetical protein
MLCAFIDPLQSGFSSFLHLRKLYTDRNSALWKSPPWTQLSRDPKRWFNVGNKGFLSRQRSEHLDDRNVSGLGVVISEYEPQNFAYRLQLVATE